MFTTRTGFVLNSDGVFGPSKHTKNKPNRVYNNRIIQNMTLKGGKKNLVEIYQYNTKIYDIQNILSLSPNLYLQQNFCTYLDSLKLLYTH